MKTRSKSSKEEVKDVKMTKNSNTKSKQNSIVFNLTPIIPHLIPAKSIVIYQILLFRSHKEPEGQRGEESKEK